MKFARGGSYKGENDRNRAGVFIMCFGKLEIVFICTLATVSVIFVGILHGVIIPFKIFFCIENGYVKYERLLKITLRQRWFIFVYPENFDNCLLAAHFTWKDQTTRA